MHKGGKKMKEVFTTNGYLQKIYFSPISEKEDSTQKTKASTDV